MLLATLTLALALVPPHAAADCGAKTSCAGCMAEPACVWCPDPALAAKCMPRVTARDTCPGHAVIDVASRVDTLEARPVSPDPGAGGQYVQISPQRVSAQLRPGRPVTLQFEVAHAKQFPIDLYFLMDLSWSMRDSRENLAKLGGDIIDAIKRKTENLATGFGSFVEKNVQPFTSAISSFNCAAEARDCTPPYSFYHRAVLGDLSPAEFSRAVLDSPMAGNIDDPEGSLDALMQVMVCGERIGWRRDSRKIIILSTDRDYHFALDGKLAGIFEPNDGLCHLNSTGGGSGYYTHGELLDYPSVSHINSVAQEHNFLVMFAVIDKYQEAYTALAERITGSHVSLLAADGSNIIDIVEDRYEEITTSVKVVANTPPDLNITFSTGCEGGTVLGPNHCANIPLGFPVTFTAELSISSCDLAPGTVTIFPIGLNENLTISVEAACDCGCGPVTPGQLAAECGGHGQLTSCGGCECEAGHYGARCGCSGLSSDQSLELCRDTAGAVCGGRGECVCGECECEETNLGTISGTFCQCSDWTCPQTAGLMCSGHGTCDCGECRCDPGWGGDTCDCALDPDTCVSPYDGEVCSGHGACRCGACVCGGVAGGGGQQHVGAWCEVTPGAGRCPELERCVHCQAFEDTAAHCGDCSFTLDYMEEEIINNNNFQFEPESPCVAKTSFDCKYKYSVRLNVSGSVWVVLHTRDGARESCSNVYMYSGLGAGAMVLLLGILSILFYKCFIVIDDRKQYANFKREVENMKSGVNQNASELYKSPITRFENPMFGKEKL